MSAHTSYYIGSTDIQTEYNIGVEKITGLLEFPQRKKPTEYDWDDEDGSEPFTIESDITWTPRDIVLHCHMDASTIGQFYDRLSALKTKILTAGETSLTLKHYYPIYRVFYRLGNPFERMTKWNAQKNVGRFKLSLREAQPKHPAIWRGLVNHLMLDDDGEVLGTDVVTNGTFTTDTAWTKSAAWTITSGKAVCDGSQLVDTTLYQAVTLTTNACFRMDYTLSAYTAGTVWAKLTQGTTVTGQPRIGNGSFTEYLDAKDNTRLNFIGNSLFQAKLDDVVFKPVSQDDLSSQATNANLYKFSVGTIYATDRNSVANEAMTFDGVDDYINTNQTFQSTFRDSFSFSMWVKPDYGQPSDTEYLCGLRTSNNNRVWLSIRSGGQINIKYTSNSNDSEGRTGAVFSNGQEIWHYIVVVLDNDRKKMYTYLNGSVQAYNVSFPGSLSSVTMSDFTITDNLHIGARNNNGTIDGHFAGTMQDFRIFDRALSHEEILVLYHTYSDGSLDI